MLVKRKVVESLCGYSSRLRLAADTEFFVRALIAGFEFRYVPVCGAFYRIRAGQLSNNVIQMQKERLEVARLAEHGRITRFDKYRALVRFRLRNIFRMLNRRRLTGWVSTDRMFSGK